MKRDEEGFLYPDVNADMCIECGLCESVCPFNNDKEYAPVIEAYACISYNDNERFLSSSGGAFSLLAKEVIKDGGVVFGMKMTENCEEAVFFMAQNEDELSSLRGSKYVQGRVNGVYKRVKQELLNGKKVLFAGTPCQVNGLKLYLKKGYENLVCADIICHGVPSPELWRKYAEYSEKKNKSKLKAVNFRSKEENTTGYGLSMDFVNSKHCYTNKEYDEYMQMFLKNISLRPSCYNCKAKGYRLADITLGDLWKAEKISPELTDSRGISFVILRNEKGHELFNKVESTAKIKRIDYNKAVQYNKSNFESVEIIPQRAGFFDDMNNMTFSELSNKYVFTDSKSRLKKQLDNIGVMKIIKKIKNKY